MLVLFVYIYPLLMRQLGFLPPPLPCNNKHSM